MRSIVDNFSSLLPQAVIRESAFRSTAHDVLIQAEKEDDVTLLPKWLRRQAMHHGLFRWSSKAGSGVEILDRNEAQSLATSCARRWKKSLLKGELLRRLWDLQIIYVIVDVGLWTVPCKTALRKALKEDVYFDIVSILMYGSNYYTDHTSIEMLVGAKWFKQRSDARMGVAGTGAASAEVVAAIGKFNDGP